MSSDATTTAMVRRWRDAFVAYQLDPVSASAQDAFRRVTAELAAYSPGPEGDAPALPAPAAPAPAAEADTPDPALGVPGQGMKVMVQYVRNLLLILAVIAMLAYAAMHAPPVVGSLLAPRTVALPTTTTTPPMPSYMLPPSQQ